MFYAGIDIGGTKSAVVLGHIHGENMEVLARDAYPTQAAEPFLMLKLYRDSIYKLTKNQGINPAELGGVGISCGGPLSSEKGLVLSPPNLPVWDNIPVVKYFSDIFSVPVYLHNDANACAIAEWKFGNGRGTKNMVFLTFGTGFGAGLILNSRIYSGSQDMAGEIGHIRNSAEGPFGYGKFGAYEGFCSGAGIVRMARVRVEQEQRAGRRPPLLDYCGEPEKITAKAIAELANSGDSLCREIYNKSAEKLGYALSLFIDLLNPDAIIIGSIYARNEGLFREKTKQVLKSECLPVNFENCKILPSALGDSVGDIAALAAAMAIC